MEAVTLEGVCPVCGKTFQASYVPEEGNVVSIKGYRIDVARRKIWGDMESHMIMHDENEYLVEQDTWEEKDNALYQKRKEGITGPDDRFFK